jgi:hypothetical protein
VKFLSGRRKENRVESRRPSAFGHEKKQNQHQTFEMRIAKTFLAMTSGKDKRIF